MRAIVSSFVAAIADFIEFDQAVMSGVQRGQLSEQQIKLAAATADAHWQRVKRAENAERGGKLDFRAEFDKASDVVKARRLERKRAIKQRQAEMAEARATKEMFAGA